MFDLTPYLGLVYTGIGVTAFVVTLKVVLNSKFLKTTADAKVQAIKKEKKNPSTIDTLEDVIENNEQKRAKLLEEIEELRKQGVTEEQMQHLNWELKMVNTFSHPMAKIAGPPLLQMAKKFAKGWGIDL